WASSKTLETLDVCEEPYQMEYKELFIILEKFLNLKRINIGLDISSFDNCEEDGQVNENKNDREKGGKERASQERTIRMVSRLECLLRFDFSYSDKMLSEKHAFMILRHHPYMKLIRTYSISENISNLFCRNGVSIFPWGESIMKFTATEGFNPS